MANMLSPPLTYCIPGVEVTYKNQVYPVLINPTNVAELTSIQITPVGVVVGASVTLTALEESLKAQVSSRPGTISLLMHLHVTKLNKHGCLLYFYRSSLLM